MSVMISTSYVFSLESLLPIHYRAVYRSVDILFMDHHHGVCGFDVRTCVRSQPAYRACPRPAAFVLKRRQNRVDSPFRIITYDILLTLSVN